MDPVKPSEPVKQYKVPSKAEQAQVQRSRDIAAERRNIVHNAFAENVRTPTVWDNAYTQGINFQPTSKGGVNLERYIDRDEFKTLGFNPFIDNESYYQSNTGFWEDFAAARKGSWDLFKIGLFSHYGTQDQYEKAQRYEKAANIGTSQRTNAVSRTFNNLVLNSGYTLGLMTGIIAEEIALGFLTAGAGNLVKAPANAIRITDKLNDVKTASQVLNDVRNVSKMRQLWDTAKGGATAAGKAMVPFGNTADIITNWSRLGVRTSDNAIELLDAGAKTSKLFGSFYRDTREILMAHDESKLEAAMLYNNMMDQMILDYQNKNNFGLPTEDDVNAFHQIARYQQDRAYWKNMMLIYASNRISFGNVFNKFNPRVLRVGEKALFQNSAGRVVADWSGKNVRQVLNEGFLNAKTLGKEALYFAKNWRHSWKYVPKAALKYGRANVGEGFQELGQEIINHAEENIGLREYDKYMKGVRGGFLDDSLYSTNFFEGYRESAAHFAGAEGLEIFGAGFLMGGVAGPYVNTLSKFTDKSTWQTISSYRNKATKAERKAELIKAKEQLDKAQEKFENLSSKEQEHIYKYVLDISRQAGRARLLDEANEDKNAKRFFDVKDETVADYILESLNHGTFDVFMENLQDLLQLDEKDLADAFKEQLNFENSEELTGIKARTQDIINSAKSIKNMYDNLDTMFPELLAFTEEEREKYKDVNLDALRQVRNMYIKTFVTQQHQLQRNLERVSKIHESLLGKGSPFNSTKDIPLTAVSTLFSEETMNREIEALESEIDTLKQTITSQKEADPKENPGAKIILARSEAALNTAEGKLKRTKELNGAFSDFTSRTRYLSLLENLQKALNSKQPGMIIGSNITFKITETGKETPYLGTIIDAEVNERGDVITKVRYLPEGETKEVETTINISQETIEELNVDTNTEGLKLSEKTQKMLRAYMDDVAKNSNTTIDPTKFDKFTQDLLDAKILKSEEEDLANMITLLMNPGVYAEMNKQFLDRHLKNKKNLKFVVRADLQEYYKTLNKNNLLQILIEKYNIFIRGNDLASIVDGLIIPELGEITMYDAKTLETIEPTNSRYQGALEEITEYVENLTEVEEETKTKEETAGETQEEKETTTPITSITVDSVKNLNSLPQEFKEMLKEKIDELNIQLEEAGTEKIDINNLDLENYDIRMLVQSVIDDYNNKSKPPETSSAVTTSTTQSEIDKKADIEKGKVGNTNYEVKSDGVYFEGKKLDNPENKKTHRQLIEADIKRRKQDELDILSITDIEELFSKKNITSKPVGEDFGTNQSMLNAYWNLVGKKHSKGILNLSSVGQVLKTGRYTDANLRQTFINLIEDEYILDKLFEAIDKGWKLEGKSPNSEINEINAKYDAELKALEETPTEEQAEIIESTENVIDKYKKLGLPIIETDTVDFTSATKEILETEPAFVIFSLEDISRSKLPNDFGGKDHVLHVKSKDRLYYFIAQDTESHRAQARSNMLSLGYPTKPTGRFTIEVPYDDTTSIYVDSEDVRQFLSDEELVNDLKVASVLVTGVVQEENLEADMLADMFDTANTIVNEELNSLKDLETVKDKLEDLLVSLRDVNVDVKNQFYKENIQPLINQKLESIKESIKPSDFKLNTAHKYQGIVYLVKRVEENSVIFVTPGQNTLTEVKQKDLWQTEPVDMDNIPQEKPVTAEEKERFSEAKENNIDVSAIVDSLSKEDMLSESEFTEDFINDLLPKCD
jgi:hypothetical protein